MKFKAVRQQNGTPTPYTYELELSVYDKKIYGIVNEKGRKIPISGDITDKLLSWKENYNLSSNTFTWTKTEYDYKIELKSESDVFKEATLNGTYVSTQHNYRGTIILTAVEPPTMTTSNIATTTATTSTTSNITTTT